MANSNEFISYKKLLIFGTEKTGKTQLSKSFDSNQEDDERTPGTRRTIKYLKDGQILGLNINEILLDDSLINDEQNLNSYLFDCQCAIFLIDITSENSFSMAKQLLTIIIAKYNPHYLHKLLVINKIDLEEERKISKLELNDYVNEFSSELESFEISLEKKENLPELWDKVNTCVNKNLMKLPINLFVEKISISDDAKTLIKAEGTFNIILVGDSGVGKSNLFSRYFLNEFNLEFISTIGLDKQMKLIKYKNHLYRISISDTAGQERFRALPLKYYQNADGALLLFDITNKDSYDHINSWMQDLQKNSKSKVHKIYLIGNKIDLPERKISQEQGQTLADSYGLKYYEMSCKSNINVNEVVSRLVVECLNDLIAESENGFQLNKKKEKKKEKNFKC